MKELDRPHAKQLFCWHAFLQPSPHQELEDLVENFLDVCHGLPLSLKVFGAQLYGISKKDYWEIQLHKVSRILPKDIKERLKISYDALDNEKQIFLDVACFFIGEEVSSAITAWDGLGWNGQHSWEQLLNKCLVELNDDRIRMHDHLHDLGREIANHQSPYRLWSPQQIINVGNEVQRIAIRGIIATAVETPSENEGFLRCSEDGKLIVKASGVNYSLEPSSLGLKFLHVRRNHHNQVIGELSRELVWLRWQDIEQRNLQSLSSLKNLRVLELSETWNGEHHLEKLWETDSNAPVQLRELFIRDCPNFQVLPKSIGCLEHLKKIIISRNKIRKLPEEFCLLQSLEHLELDGSELSSLPSSFGDLKNLRHLAFFNCQKLRRLPVSFKELTLLQHLFLQCCYELTLESDILENMTRLVYFIIDGSNQLEELPRHITNQPSLTELCCYSKKLKEIPVNIGQLSKLRRMDIRSELMTSLPTSIGDLSSLTYLHISYCHKLECLPESLGRLDLLRNLRMDFVGVKSLPKSLGQLINLQKLEIMRCPTGELDLGAGLFTCLKEIYLKSTEVSKISISEDSPLEWLRFWDNGHLKEIEVLPNTLQHISLMRCPNLDVLPSFAQLGSLESFIIKGCYRVKKIPGLEHCRAMERLRKVELQAINRSSFEGFIHSMQDLQKWPKEEIIVCTRAVPDAATIVNSFVNSFPNLSVVDSFANQKLKSDPFLKWPSAARCILLCFVVNC
ncbi:disease resistance protein RUN1 isoform X1 [Cryptomeria japonica]|uniref:disease resistance protein RUN1 isoform X1 n=1 Tax=Cryptomeria japonica TaxID=3369 RepID=UPI0027DAB3E9|nr:disease resistance protein RUN1 isoform X1 [Cryptomeria japonica]